MKTESHTIRIPITRIILPTGHLGQRHKRHQSLSQLFQLALGVFTAGVIWGMALILTLQRIEVLP